MRIRFSPLIASASGKAADAVASSWKGRAYIRKLVIPHNPQTAAQTLVRNSLTRCVTLWRSLTTILKTWLNTYGTGYRISGYNVFMQKNRALEQAESLLKVVPDHPHCPAPSTLVFATGAGASGDIDVTWVDNAPENYNTLYFALRPSGGNIFTLICTDVASDETSVIGGLTPATDYDCYGFYYNDTIEMFGTCDGDLDVTTKA